MLLVLVIAISFTWVVAQAPAQSPGYPSCNVCGKVGYRVTNSNATISFPGYPIFTCDVVQRGALAGFVNPMYCPVFPLFNIPNICGCKRTTTASPSLQANPPTPAPSRHVEVTVAPTVSPSVKPTINGRNPNSASVTTTQAPYLTTESPTSSPTLHVLAPVQIPVVATFVPFSPLSTPVKVKTAPPIPAILAPELTPSAITPSNAPVVPTREPVTTIAPVKTSDTAPAAIAVVVTPSVSPMFRPTPTTPSISSIHSPTRQPAVPDLSAHPNTIARKRRPTKPFHIGETSTATPTMKSNTSAHRPHQGPLSAPITTSSSRPRQRPSLGATSSPRATHRHRPNNVRNSPPTTALPSRSTSRTRRHRHKPSAQSRSSTARDTISTPAPSSAPKGTSRDTHAGKGNIFDRGQSLTKQGSKLFKDLSAKKMRKQR